VTFCQTLLGTKSLEVIQSEVSNGLECFLATVRRPIAGCHDISTDVQHEK